MIRASVLILSEGIILDTISGGTASLYNVLENVQVSKFPGLMPKVSMFALLERKEDDPKIFDLEAKLFNNEDLIQSIQIKLDFKNELKHKRFGFFINVAIKSLGNLSVSLIHDGEEINRYSANVSQMLAQPVVPSKK